MIQENNKSDLKSLEYYFKKAKSNHIQFEGYCHDCNKLVNVIVDIEEDGKVIVNGGAVYFPSAGVFLKCDECFKADKILRNFQPCEVFSRVVGFLTPTNQWNKGKQSEWRNRKDYKLPTEKELRSLNFE